MARKTARFQNEINNMGIVQGELTNLGLLQSCKHWALEVGGNTRALLVVGQLRDPVRQVMGQIANSNVAVVVVICPL